MITQHTIQQILSRIDIIDIVGSFVKLKKRGTNYLGLCPFHNEKTPSFTVSPVKEIYKCFGCGKSGNSISFLMDHEKYSYVEASMVGQPYNVEIEETEVSPAVKELQQTADSLYIINSFAQKFSLIICFKMKKAGILDLVICRNEAFMKILSENFNWVIAVKIRVLLPLQLLLHNTTRNIF